MPKKNRRFQAGRMTQLGATVVLIEHGVISLRYTDLTSLP
jgi:hypothetical protein